VSACDLASVKNLLRNFPVSALPLIALTALCGLILFVALGGGIVAATKRRWPVAAACVVVAGLLAITTAFGALKLGFKGVGFAWRNTVEPVRRHIAEMKKAGAEAAKKQAEAIAARKALVDPALLASAPEDFFTYDGFRDWWRLPLVFPYELGWIDTFETADLQRYLGGDVRDPNKSSEQNVQGVRTITGFAFDRRFLIGREGPPYWEKTRPESWFIFEFSTATLTQFTSEPEMIEAAKVRGYTGETSLKSIEQRFNEYF
jgi:hypothetical protein